MSFTLALATPLVAKTRVAASMIASRRAARISSLSRGDLGMAGTVLIEPSVNLMKAVPNPVKQESTPSVRTALGPHERPASAESAQEIRVFQSSGMKDTSIPVAINARTSAGDQPKAAAHATISRTKAVPEQVGSSLPKVATQPSAS